MMLMMMIFWKVSKWTLGHHLETSEPKTSVMTRQLSIWRICQENFKLHWMVSESFANKQKLQFRVIHVIFSWKSRNFNYFFFLTYRLQRIIFSHIKWIFHVWNKVNCRGVSKLSERAARKIFLQHKSTHKV